MSGHDTKYRLWSVATKKQLVLTVSKDGNDPTITCTKSYGDKDGSEESSKLQHCILMNSFLSLQCGLAAYFIVKLTIFDLCIMIDLVFLSFQFNLLVQNYSGLINP